VATFEVAAMVDEVAGTPGSRGGGGGRHSGGSRRWRRRTDIVVEGDGIDECSSNEGMVP
jgi:hypothetical protein